MIRPIVPATTDRDDCEQSAPVRRLRLAALAAGHGLVRLTERYLPALVVALGDGPIAVGALAALGLGTAATAARSSSIADEDGESTRVPAAIAALLAVVGLLAVAGAPALDDLFGTPLSALGWLVVGVVLLQAWHVFGLTRRLWPTDTRTSSGSSTSFGTETRAERRTRLVCGALGVGVAAAIATAAVASTGGVRPGVALLATIGAAVVLVCAVVPGRAGVVSRVGDESLENARNVVPTVPDRRRWAVVGDALVRVATVGIAPFLILLLAVHEPIGLSIGGRSLAPAAVFGLFVLAEATGALCGAIVAPSLASRVDRRGLLAVGLAVVSLFPMALVAAPGSASVAALFALFGGRTAIEPLRPTLGDVRAAPVPGSRLPEGVRSAVRLAVVPAPLVAGVLYALEPLIAFTAATTVGLLGVRELGRAFSFGRGRER